MKTVDKLVILRWIDGDKEAFEVIVKTFMEEAFLAALGFVGNEEDARDLSQDAFLKAHRARKTFDPDKPFYPWFHRIIKNHCLNFLKSSRRRRGDVYYEGGIERERFESRSLGPLENLEKNERVAILRAAIASLSDDHREIIMLKNFHGRSYKEIAEILHIPIGTVMSRLFYARKMLKSLIEKIESEGLPQRTEPRVEARPSTGEVV